VSRRPEAWQDGTPWSFALGVACGPLAEVVGSAAGELAPGVPLDGMLVAAGTAGLVPEVPVLEVTGPEAAPLDAAPLDGVPLEDVHPAITPATPTATMSAAGVLFAASFITPMTLPGASWLTRPAIIGFIWLSIRSPRNG